MLPVLRLCGYDGVWRSRTLFTHPLYDEILPLCSSATSLAIQASNLLVGGWKRGMPIHPRTFADRSFPVVVVVVVWERGGVRIAAFSIVSITRDSVQQARSQVPWDLGE